MKRAACILALIAASAQAREIRFTTGEGTWMSVNVSPDGSTIVFDLLGDIYVMPFAGGTAKPILTGMAFESQPRFSPDGKQITFTSDRDGAVNLWIANADGSIPRQLSHLKGSNFFSPAWMPDGKSILVSVVSPARRGGAELWRFPADGGAGEVVKKVAGAPPILVSAPAQGVFGATPSPDGKSIYFAAVTPRVYNSRSGAASEIVRLDLATHSEEVLSQRGEVAMKPLVSSDGKWLAYAQHYREHTGLRIRHLETQQERWLRVPIQRDELEARASRDVLPNYAFTPDSRFLVLAIAGKLHRIEVTTGNDVIIPLRAEVNLELAERLDFPAPLDDSINLRARIAQNPALSPDGTGVVFSALGQLFISNNGGPPRRLTATEHAREFQPAWSPDGEWIAYVTWSASGSGQIWKIRRDGTGAQALTSAPAYYHDPVWTPNGAAVVALRAIVRDRPEDIIRIANKEVTSIAPADGLTRPHFAKDRLYLYSPQQGLVSMNLDGSGRRAHARVPGSFDVQVSPDGVHAAARVDANLFLFELPSDPSKPVDLTKLEGARGADTMRWANAGTVTWALGSSFFRKDTSNRISETHLSVDQPRRRPTGITALRGADVITMRGNEVIRNADLVIQDNRIAAIGPRGAITIPPGARTIDVTGQTIMPGLIDIHAHFSPPREIPDVSTYEFPANLAYGVTSVRDPQSFSNDIFVYSDLAETGELIGPRIFSTGPGVFEQNNFKSYDEVRQAVSRYTDYYRTHLLKSYLVGDRQVRQWIVQACRELHVMPTTEGGSDFALNLTHAIDGFSGNEHALPSVPLSNDVVQLFAQTGITYTPTLIVAFGGPFPIFEYLAKEAPENDPKLRRWFPPQSLYNRATSRLLWFAQEEYIYPQIAAGAAAIQKAGGSVAIGGHGELQGLQTHWEMWMLASGGMANHEILRAATINGARAIGLGQSLGSIEPGKMADLIVLSKDPLANIRNTTSIRYVMRNGELFDAATLEQIAPSRRPAPDPVWLRDQPPLTR